MSQSNIQEVREQVRQLRREVREARQEVLQFQVALSASLSLFRRLGLPPKINEAISRIQRMIMFANQARLAVLAFYAASGPLGWIMFGIAAGGAILTGGDMFVEAISH